MLIDNYTLFKALLRGVKVYCIREWWKRYGQLWCPANVLLFLLTFKYSRGWYPLLLCILSTVLSLTITLMRFHYFSAVQFYAVLLWASKYWGEAEHWKEAGIEKIKENLDVEVALVMFNIKKRYGIKAWDFLIEYGKHLGNEKTS